MEGEQDGHEEGKGDDREGWWAGDDDNVLIVIP